MTESPPRSTLLATSARWLIAFAFAAVGTFAARKYIIGLRERSATRLVLADFARFQGCLLAEPIPSDAEAPARVFALALGTGDDAWPHSCALPLTRLEHTTDDMHGDDPAAETLGAAVRHAENGLGEAVFWTEHVQEGRSAAPEWLDSYIALRRAVETFARAHGASLMHPEFPRRPRVPRPVDSSAAPTPRPVPLTGGAAADLVDATATPEMLTLVMRDERERHAICRWPVSPADAPIACVQFTLPIIADPRYAGFVPSDRGPHLAVWGRAPYSLRGLVDANGQRIVLIAAGDPDATRDYYVGPAHSLAVQIDRAGPTLLVEDNGLVRHVPLPHSLDVLTPDRALLGDPTGALEAWLDTRSHTQTTLFTVSFDSHYDHASAPVVAARWTAPRMHEPDRRIVPCSVPGGPRYLAAGDRVGGTLFLDRDGHALVRGPEIPLSFDPPPRIACDTHGVTLAAGVAPTAFAHCDEHNCTVHRDVPLAPTFAMTRTDGQLVLADSDAAGALRVRTMNIADGTLRESTIAGPLPPVHDVRLAARDRTVALFVAEHETFALRSTDAGHSFTPAVVAR